MREVSERIRSGVKRLVTEKREGVNNRSSSCEPLISGAISSALCVIHKSKRLFKSSRIAVLTPSTDYPFFLTTQYMNFMNTFFTAQKMDVMMDVAVRKSENSSDDGTSSILRQGCDITGGSYLSVPKPEALLQYLMVSILFRDSYSCSHTFSPFSGSCFQIRRRGKTWSCLTKQQSDRKPHVSVTDGLWTSVMSAPSVYQVCVSFSFQKLCPDINSPLFFSIPLFPFTVFCTFSPICSTCR